jgi:hypothetical protein
MNQSLIISKEMREIEKLISSASLIMAVREETKKILRTGFVVTDGKHNASSPDYDVIVRCPTKCSQIARRIRAGIPNIDVVHLADNVLGVKTARRGDHGE